MQSEKFWQSMDALVRGDKIVIDRPRGTAHPRYPGFIYPYDYGYLNSTQAPDMSGIDVWIGSQPERGATAVLCTVDLIKHDAELKILWGCTAEEAHAILEIHNSRTQSAVLVEREHEEA